MHGRGKAVARGLKVPGFVKTSLAPGSKVVTEYLSKAGLLPDLEALGFLREQQTLAFGVDIGLDPVARSDLVRCHQI